MVTDNTHSPLILVADDEAAMRANIIDLLSDEGYNFIEASNGNSAFELAVSHEPDLILLDIKMPKRNGIEALRLIKEQLPETPVIVFTAFGISDYPIETMKAGAFDYIEKPFDIDEFLDTIKRGLDQHLQVKKTKSVSDSAKINGTPVPESDDSFVGSSQNMKHILKLVGKVASTDTTVLLQGESGTGKEVVADIIQKHSPRADKPYIKINCGAIPEPLLESELFGHEEGAFTGAVKKRTGRFELADSGTIFLDEINSMPVSTQVKLLRIIQNRTFEPVGSETTKTTNIRIIAATNANLEQLVKEGKFREDLYYRLEVMPIRIPALREHPEDIPQLVKHFLKRYMPSREILVSDDAMNKLQAHDWPGNVRELENVVQRALVMAQGDLITLDSLPLSTSQKIADNGTALSDLIDTEDADRIPFNEIIASVEKDLISRALDRCNGNKSKAAEMLEINRRLLYAKISKYGLDHF